MGILFSTLSMPLGVLGRHPTEFLFERQRRRNNQQVRFSLVMDAIVPRVSTILTACDRIVNHFVEIGRAISSQVIEFSPHELPVKRHGRFGNIFVVKLGVDIRQSVVESTRRQASMLHICSKRRNSKSQH